MSRHLPTIILALFTLTVTSGGLGAQGRGRGGHFGPPRGNFPAGASRPSVVGRGSASGVAPAVTPQFIYRPQVARSQPRVRAVQPFYGFNYPYVWSSPVYPAPAYIAPVYAAPAYVQPPPASRNELELSYQVQRLSQELDQLRQEQALAAAARQPAPPPAAPTAAAEPEPERIQPLTTLIFRDGSRQNIRNYAIVGGTLWVLDEQVSSRIAISDLDLEATQQENRAQGVRFPLPR